MAVREFIGMRVVPILGRIGEESIIWDGGEYEPLTIVMTEGGDTYISRCTVPAGTEITNEHYWAKFAEFNAQFALLQQTVETYNARITANTEKNAQQDTEIASLDGDVDDIASNVTTINATVTEQGETISAHTSAITGNAEDIDALEQQMAGTTDSGLKTAIDSVQEEVESIITADWSSYAGHKMVAFGDSWMAPNITNSVDAYLPKRIATTMGMTLHNFAVAGAGWARENNTMAMQLTTANAQMTADDKADVRLVLAFAGLNDYLNSVSDVTAGLAFANFAASARTMFPNAKIVMVPMNWQFSKLTYAALGWIYNFMRYALNINTSGCVVLSNAWWWIMGYATLYQNQAHPNMSGYNYLAAQILNGIAGGAPIIHGRANSINVASTSNLTAGVVYMECNSNSGNVSVNGYVSYNGDASLPVDITFLDTANDNAKFPQYFPGGVTLLPVNSTTAGSSPADSYVRWNEDGTAVAHFGSGYTKGSNLWFTGSWPFSCGTIEWSAVN